MYVSRVKYYQTLDIVQFIVHLNVCVKKVIKCSVVVLCVMHRTFSGIILSQLSLVVYFDRYWQTMGLV